MWSEAEALSEYGVVPEQFIYLKRVWRSHRIFHLFLLPDLVATTGYLSGSALLSGNEQ
jgi:hypothetical protein